MQEKSKQNLSTYTAYLIALALGILCFTNTQGQYLIRLSEKSPEYLVNRVLMSPEAKIKTDSIQLLGHTMSCGKFSSPQQLLPVSKGLVLSTGLISEIVHENTATNSGRGVSGVGEVFLDKLVKNKTYDSTILQFDFIADADSISFSYFFASEEYPEYVGRGVNDVFVFEIIEKKTGESRNLAILNNEIVCVDNINSQKNSNYFIMNPQVSRELSPKAYLLAKNFMFDGFTTKLHATSRIKPNVAYRMKMAIADVGDKLYDSAVFIEYKSFTTHKTKPLNPVNSYFRTAKHDSIVRRNIEFKLNSSTIEATSAYTFLDSVAIFMQTSNNLQLEIHGHTDNTGSATSNQQLSEQRAKTVATYLQSVGVQSNRLRTKGFGNTKPIVPNESKVGRKQNRRVEFYFYKKQRE